MMNVIGFSSQVLFMSSHGGGGSLVLSLTAPVVRVADGGTGGSAVFRMVGEPPEAAYSETRLYRFDEVAGSFSVLDAVFERGEVEKVVEGLTPFRRYGWLPVAFDVEGNYVPAGVVSAVVTDGSPGLVEGLRLELVSLLREDSVLAGYHGQWAAAAADRCHVVDRAREGGGVPGGRAPFVEVETVSVEGDASVVRAVFRLRAVAASGLERLCEDVRLAVLRSGLFGLGCVLRGKVRVGGLERGSPLARGDVFVEVEMAVKM